MNTPIAWSFLITLRYFLFFGWFENSLKPALNWPCSLSDWFDVASVTSVQKDDWAEYEPPSVSDESIDCADS